MARRNQLPEMFQDINDHRAGNLIMELIEPSTKEEFLSREYLELKAQGIDLPYAVEVGSSGASSDINEYLQTYVESQAPRIASQASRVTGLRFHPEDIVRKLSGVTVHTLNETLDNALTELYYIYKG